MKFNVDNNTSEMVRKMLARMKIEQINSKNLKKKLRIEKKKNTSKRTFRQKAAMYHRKSLNPAYANRSSKEKINLSEKIAETIV